MMFFTHDDVYTHSIYVYKNFLSSHGYSAEPPINKVASRSKKNRLGLQKAWIKYYKFLPTPSLLPLSVSWANVRV